jgi:hypothetical protein
MKKHPEPALVEAPVPQAAPPLKAIPNDGGAYVILPDGTVVPDTREKE